MKIKYKIIIVMALVIITASLPLTLFILDSQEKEKIRLLLHQGEVQSRILSHAVMNILLMNGGDVEASRVDAGAMMRMLAPLVNDGLVYADAILLSSRKIYNGMVIASFFADARFMQGNSRISGEDVDDLTRSSGAREIMRGGMVCYEFVNTASAQSGPPLALGRLVYSRSMILKDAARMRRISYTATAVAIAAVGLLGLFLSRYISKPIDELTEAVSSIELIAKSPPIKVRSRDEIGKLANTFNHMVRTINLEIAELVSVNMNLKRLDRLKDEFLANISHELKTPLSGIIGLAESLMGGVSGEISGDGQQNLDLIARSGRRLSSIVDDILDFARLKNSDVEIRMIAVDLHSVAEFVISVLRPLIEKKGLNVLNRIDPTGVPVLGDDGRLQQIMMNIIGNAVKFTDEGSITIDASAADAGSGMVVVTVTDSGIGIPAGRTESIFESFEQADGSIARRYGGTGLGLAITKKLVELHGGEIRAESIEGRGSAFTFTLKVSDSAGADKGLPGDSEGQYPVIGLFNDNFIVNPLHHESAAGSKNKRILAVDDDPVSLRVLMNFLSMDGYDVETAGDGVEALEMLKKNIMPDLILLDVMLPGMSGYDVCSIIRRSHSQYELPVIMLTARNRPEDIAAGIRSGANDYIGKPAAREELLARVASLISLGESVARFNELNLIKREIHIAHEIHHSAVIQEIPHIDNVRFTLRFRPMQELGGDFYDIIKIDDRRFGIFLSDVSGHGISAAIMCAMLKMAISFNSGSAGNPAEMLKSVNRSIYNYLGDYFITACYAFIDLGARVMIQANAGHWPVLLWKGGSGSFLINEENGMPFGMVEGPEYENMKFDLEKGDRVILYTDGIIEARNNEGKMLGLDNFCSLMEGNCDLEPGELSDKIMDSLGLWQGPTRAESLEDDATLLMVDIIG